MERKEDNFFFALSKYQKPLEDLLAQQEFVKPPFRKNEVRRGGLCVFPWVGLEEMGRRDEHCLSLFRTGQPHFIHLLLFFVRKNEIEI